MRRYSLADLADPDRVAELFHLLSRDAVAAGALDEFAASVPPPKGKAVQRGLFTGGYQRMDRTFLAELEEHREVLARSVEQTNPGLDGHALTEITQRSLDRLIFTRLLEDKLIEPNYLVVSFGDKSTTAPAARLLTLKSISPEFASAPWLEGLLRGFRNRPQPAAYAGLAPSPWQSGTMGGEQAISKSGNPRLRTAMVELAWPWPRHQPDSALSR